MDTKPLRPNDIIDAWKLGKKLGVGGQGEVWEVRSIEAKHSPPRAMKISLASDPHERSRFEREVQTLKMCDHPNILRVIDENLAWATHERTSLSVSYYITERFESSLDSQKWIHQAPILAVQLFDDLCSAVDYLHDMDRPILHRDIKPSNLMYGAEHNRVVLGDLGISLTTQTDDKSLTKVGEVVGTPFYRAPEVANGARCDFRSDVYGLGRTLEWLMTAREPSEMVPHEVVRSYLSSGAAENLNFVIRTACAFDPEKRFARVGQLREALPRLVADLSTTKRDAGASSRADYEIPNDAAEAYADAKRQLSAREVVAWRDVSKIQRREVSKVFVAWRRSRLTDGGVNQETLEQWMDEALALLGPFIVRACAVAELPQAELGDATAVIRDLLSIEGWQPNGHTVLVEFPWSVAYVAHNVIGSLAVSVANEKLVGEIFGITVRDRNGEVSSLAQNMRLIGWPESLGSDAKKAWRYLTSLSERHDWVENVFGSAYDFRISLLAYWWRLSFNEFCRYIKNNTLADLVEMQSVFLHVPPVWLETDSDLLFRAFRLAFASNAQVASLTARAGVDEKEVREGWSIWQRVLARNQGRARFFGGGFEVPDLP